MTSCCLTHMLTLTHTHGWPQPAAAEQGSRYWLQNSRKAAASPSFVSCLTSQESGAVFLQSSSISCSCSSSAQMEAGFSWLFVEECVCVGVCKSGWLASSEPGYGPVLNMLINNESFFSPNYKVFCVYLCFSQAATSYSFDRRLTASPVDPANCTCKHKNLRLTLNLPLVFPERLPG